VYDDSGDGERKAHWTGRVVCRRDQLTWPFHKRAPLVVFVGDRGDLFHAAVPDRFIAEVFTAAYLSQHTFLMLTKRPQRMCEYVTARTASDDDAIRNIWLGTTVEDQQRHDERVPILRETPAALRFLSVEPLLGPVKLDLRGVGWVIVGGESGPGARPCHREWVTSIVRQCKDAAVPVWVKQLGANQRYDFGASHPFPRQRSGSDMAEWPIDLRIRERPAIGAARAVTETNRQEKRRWDER
jgi:protein gp37